MSVKCMAWVLEYSESRLSERLVLLALAEYAHDDGTMAFPAVETLAKKARIGKSTCHNCLRKLEERGDIERTGMTRAGTVIYRVLMPETTTNGGVQNREGPESRGVQNRDVGVQNRDTGVQILDPNRQEPPVTVISENAGARGRETVASVKVRGRSVKPECWSLTAQVLDEFNAQAGTKLRLTTSGGAASEAAKRVYCRVVDYPDISFEEHADIIRRTLSSEWWGKTPPTIGVVYGPKVFEDNITRPGKNVMDGSKQDRDRRRMSALARLIGGEAA